MRKPRKTPKLTMPQTCMTANFYDAACDFPRTSFAKITRRMLGAKGFPITKSGEVFKRECRKAFGLTKG
jgi:hypothetical protein